MKVTKEASVKYNITLEDEDERAKLLAVLGLNITVPIAICSAIGPYGDAERASIKNFMNSLRKQLLSLT